MSDTQTAPNNIFQEIMGNRITKLVLWGTILIGVVGIVFAFIALNQPEAKVKVAFGILQYIFGALLPLWGTWIGTILAYYYSKQNFESASNSVRQMVDKITSQQKLESVKAKDVMIPLDKLIFETMASSEDLSKFTIRGSIDFVKNNKIKRFIILDENKCAKYAIHKSIISDFVTETTPAIDQATYTLKDMYTNANKELKDLLDNSVKFITEDASLLTAKKIMEDYKNCQDVFITKTGNSTESVIGWITNVTISENSIV